MNPAKPAATQRDRGIRALMTLRTIGVAAAVGYARRNLTRTQQLYLIDEIRSRYGITPAAQAMRIMGWTFEAALQCLCGPRAVYRAMEYAT